MADLIEPSSFRFDPPSRILLGPGPSNVSQRVLAALARPTVGYLDASYLDLLGDVQRMLRRLFLTSAPATFAVTGSGTAAMECALANSVEPGDRALVCVHGFFGDRMRMIFERLDADVEVVATPWGRPTDPADVARVLAERPARVVAVVHGETSTGVLQPIRELAEIAQAHGALLVVDTVASLGGVEFDTEGWSADVVYSGSQKCLSVPPGISPITFGARAMERIRARKRPCRSWYLDAELNLAYWQKPHTYHHTGPINLMYALYEGLRILEEEGLQRRIARTWTNARALWAGLDAMGIEPMVAPEHRLPTLTTVVVPRAVDEFRVRSRLIADYGIEIAGGLGELKGRTWRIGLMGESCTRRNVLLLLAAMEDCLALEKHPVRRGASIEAAMRCVDESA